MELWQLVLIAVTALGAQIVGGIAGYGTGLLMPLVLVPLIGAEAVYRLLKGWVSPISQEQVSP